MKILFVVTGLGMGGAERQVADLADQFDQRGHDVSIASLSGDIVVRPGSPGVRVIPIAMSKSPGGVLRGYLALRRLIRRLKPDVVHSHMVHANIVTRLVRLSTRMPCLISTAHSTDEGGRGRMWAYRLTGFLADLSTNVSDQAVAAFESKGAVTPGTMMAVANGIDTERFRSEPDAGATLRSQQGTAPDTRIILSVGRLAKEKDHDRLLQAFAAIASVHHAVLWIAGDGPLRNELQTRATTLGIAEKVRFLGIRDDIPALMNAADVFVLSSVFEGFGLVIAEAMACERVVVATDSGGVRDVVGDAGFLVPPEDTDALAKGLTGALALSTQDARTLGQRARVRVVERYSLNAAVNRWLDIYSTASNKAAAKRRR